MALIVEDGTMPEGANSYASVEDGDAYLVPRGISDWPAPVQGSDLEPDPNLPAKEAALIRASDYLNSLQWLGSRQVWDWPMAWPRANVPLPGMPHGCEFVPGDSVPQAVKRACIELAALFMGGEDPLAPVERGGRVASETVGPLSTTYFEDAASETLYPAVSGLAGMFLAKIPGQAQSVTGMVEAGRS